MQEIASVSARPPRGGLPKDGFHRLGAGDRRDRIALLLAQSGYLSISELADHLGVSEMTVRRDLDRLVEKGLVSRAHGGAVSRLHATATPRPGSARPPPRLSHPSR